MQDDLAAKARGGVLLSPIGKQWRGIQGQLGQSEAERYYKFYDNVQYYLRLLKVAQNYLETNEGGQTNSSDEPASVAAAAAKQLEQADHKLAFRRKLESLRSRLAGDSFASSFVGEFETASGSERQENKENPFELYESFIKRTEFGQNYARNLSTVRESVRAFNHICQHLEGLSLANNLTRPSRQYQTIRRMALRLFQLRHQLLQKVSPSILSNRLDTRRLFGRLEELVEARPEIRMLGDEFGDQEAKEEAEAEAEAEAEGLVEGEENRFFSDNVRRLNGLLDGYTQNNMTRLTFYNELANLPQQFIVFGARIARDYEERELPEQNRFHFGQQLDSLSAAGQPFGPSPSHLAAAAAATSSADNSTSGSADARHSSPGNFLSSLIG